MPELQKKKYYTYLAGSRKHPKQSIADARIGRRRGPSSFDTKPLLIGLSLRAATTGPLRQRRPLHTEAVKNRTGPGRNVRAYVPRKNTCLHNSNDENGLTPPRCSKKAMSTSLLTLHYHGTPGCEA
ncbi:hypothetical protein EVAR_75892_1 [Eumeta japonica]|uniref:Uncharacterized protein n=1 Tax=Eumeta variegata TaxID=151549 RepID=A0A4C1UW05_EUMVA|nr:hypothetical protein EVAR_75892_1 [Eumeta japonica]